MPDLRPMRDYHAAARELESLPVVEAARVRRRAPAIVGLALEAGLDRVPPSVLRVAAERDLGIETTTRLADDRYHVVLS